MSSMRDNMQAVLAPIPLALTVIAFVVGYQARGAFNPVVVNSGAPNGTRSFSSSSKASKSKRRGPVSPPGTDYESDSSSGSAAGGTDSESDADDEAKATAADLSALKPGSDEIKLVLVVNDSLKMTKGKIGAQCGHATLACYETLARSNPRLISRWKMYGQPKIALRCASTEEMEALATQARSLNLCARTIQDAGRTQVAPGSKTVLGVGPGPARLINQVTGKLKLL